jgi:hypothetical protein
MVCEGAERAVQLPLEPIEPIDLPTLQKTQASTSAELAYVRTSYAAGNDSQDWSVNVRNCKCVRGKATVCTNLAVLTTGDNPVTASPFTGVRGILPA